MTQNLRNLYIVLSLSLCALLPARAAEDSSSDQPAQITFTVLKFNPSTASSGAKQYTDAIAELAPHPSVTVSGDLIYPIFHPQRSVDFEIKVKSNDPQESYTPIGVTFQQNPRQGCARNDPIGNINFAPAHLSGTALVFRDRFVITGPESRYEFFIVIRRASDGAIGVIDPDIEVRPN